MSLSDGTGRALMPDNTNRALFLRLATIPVVRLWTGRGKERVDANDVDSEPQIYLGLGVLRNIPEIDRLLQGDARRISVTVSGLQQEIVNLIDEDMIGTEGVEARIGHLRYDRHWRPTTAMRWAWTGTLDEIGLESKQQEGGHEWSIGISMSSALVDRNRPGLLYWTPKDQAAISPTDRAFDNVPGYNAGTTRLYPPR